MRGHKQRLYSEKAILEPEHHQGGKTFEYKEEYGFQHIGAEI